MTRKFTELSVMEKSLLDDPTCYRCRRELPSPVDSDYPAQRDECLSVALQGGYGMFHDMVELGCVVDVYLCHDCSAELFRFLGFDPRTQTDMRGLHPYEKEGSPCCEFGWTGTEHFGENDPTLKSVEFGYEIS